MPQAAPAERVVDRREPGDEAAAAVQLRPQLGERDVRRRRDQRFEVGLIRREQGASIRSP